MLNSILLFLNLGGGEVFFILVVVLLFFGSKRIPELAKGLGKGMREFKDAMGGIEREVRDAANTDTPKSVPPATTSFNPPTAPTGSVTTSGSVNSGTSDTEKSGDAAS